MLLSDGFLATAKDRLRPERVAGEADLRRCLSDLYFALFHTLCETLAFSVKDDVVSPAAREAWLRLYRLPDHALVAKGCDDTRIRDLPTNVQRFAGQFKTMKTLREDADYDGAAQFEATEVRKYLEVVESAITGFRTADDNARWVFATLVSIKRR